MAVVTGDRYLNSLVKFVDKHTGSLLDGTLILKLNPVGLHYIQSRLESLQEVECLLAGAPIDYLRAYISDLGDHRALEQLRRILRLLTSLKIMSMVPPPGRDPTPLCLLPFGRIKVLELRGCDLSTSAARGLLELRHTLEKIICHNSTDALRHVFASRIADIKDSPLWNRLSLVSCAHNGLVLMDESLQLLPVVETLDLSRNRFAKVDNLRKCTKLRHLDLGFNHLRTIASLSEVVCPIVKLVLRNNALTTLRGIENLTSVEGLDLSYNIISSFSELELLAGLSSLRSLWLEGNPICCARWYRAQVFSFFAQPEMLKLDERTISKKESWKRQIILASRQKKPAGYGFYIPAKDEAEEEGSFYAKQRKTSRLACIEDEERRRYFGPEAVDLESVSCDSETPKRDENVISESEAEIVGLMNRVEFMKKERSVLWLREFGEWMDQTSMDMVNGNKFIESISTTGKEKYMKRKKSQKHLGETSTYVSESVQASGDESSTNILESDYSFADTVIGSHGPEYFDPNSKDVLDGSRDSIPVLRIGGMGSEQDQLMTYSHEEPNLLPLAATNSFLTDTLKVERGDMPYSKVNSTALTALDEIMESRSSSIYPGSPPHYQEDILHRRQNLEEEFLQLSAESLSVASSDSDTSCSDDDSYHFETSFPRVDRLLNEVPLDKSRSNHPDVLLFEDNYHEKRHGDPQTIENNRSLLDFHTEPASTVVKSLKTDHSEPCCTDGILADAGGGSINQECLEKGKAKRKPKRRVVSLPEQNCMAGNTKLLFPKLNGVSEIGKVDIKLRVERPVFIENDYHKPHEKVDEQASMNEVKSPPIYGAGSSLWTKSGSPNPEIDEFIKNYFDAQITGSRVSETCLQFMLCNCILQQGSGFGECEIAVLLSSENKLYMLQMSATHDGPGTISKVLGCHRLEDIKEVVIGIGLHIMRVHTENDASYLFITRSVEQSRRLLCLLQLCDSSGLTNTCALRSWEQVQVKLFEKHICGGLKMSIFLYSMLLFWHNDSKGESWLLRSLFVIEGYMFVCIEDLVQFSSLTDDTGLSAYFSLDSCCHISSISEMIIEPRESRCLTLTLDHLTSEKIRFPFQLEKEKQSEEDTSGSCTWKLKWFSEDTLLKFVSLLKAIHAGVSASPLPVRCIP